MTPSAPTKLGHYKIHSQICEGGMGKVYLAEDASEPGRIFALTLLLTFTIVVSGQRPPLATNTRPNIVFILIDDLRWDELGIAAIRTSKPLASTESAKRARSFAMRL